MGILTPMAPRLRFTREQLAEVVAASSSYAAVARSLGYKGRSSGSGMVKRWIEHHEIPTDHFGGTGSHSGRAANFEHTKEQLEAAVANAKTMSDVCRNLGRSTEGGTSTHLRNVIRRLEIDTSHFLTRQEFSKLNGARRKGADSILLLLPDGANRTNALTLRRAMLEVGFVEVCAVCGLSPEWNGLPLTLQVDHENGKRLDNRRENLRFLCPNCHSQQPTTLDKTRRY